jgi:hypothetical protein
MNPSAAAILNNPQPCGHIVYPYTDETQIAEAVCLFTSAGLRKGEAVLLVMRENHVAPIRQRLEAEGHDLAALQANGQLVCEDASALLASFLDESTLDELAFKTKIGSLIEKAKAVSSPRPVRVFGEMVDLIWKTDPKPTHRMEELWNEVIQAHSVPLLCAYSLAGPMPDALPQELLACHSHAIA